jgi:poly-gamma-glutamate synthesis protein (capsule biosynthesis protein)
MKDFKLLFVGDVVLPKKRDEPLFSSAFDDIFNKHEIRSCNFEAPITGFGAPIKKAGPNLSQHKFAPKYLEDIGFNVFNLANNHIYDYGTEALSATLNALSSSLTAGAGLSFKEAYELKIYKAGDTKVGFLSYCEAEFGAYCYEENTTRGGYAWINHDSVLKDIAAAKTSVDVLIIQAHAGVEDIELPLPEWRSRYRKLIEAGADAVIASHPHVPQGWETHHDRPIFYSLGNFCFDIKSNSTYWNEGLAVSITISHKKISNYSIIPIIFDGKQIDVNRDEIFSMHLKHINEALIEPDYSCSINRLVKELWETRYKIYYQNAMNSVYPGISFSSLIKYAGKKLLNRPSQLHLDLLLHNVRIESHRWVVERYLSLDQNL